MSPLDPQDERLEHLPTTHTQKQQQIQWVIGGKEKVLMDEHLPLFDEHLPLDEHLQKLTANGKVLIEGAHEIEGMSIF